jgi:ABC-type nitrate/sulfonate/bicarbonate transport system substrate-binding protein
MKIRLALEGFQTPNHLPLIAGIEQGGFAEAGLDVELVARDDALEAVAAGEIELACSTPLHMLDAPRPGLRALGCFFETEGGLLILNSAMETLAAGDRIRLTVPDGRGLSATIAVQILRRWFESHHPSIGLDQIRTSAAGFQHIENLHAGFEAVWPCFANFEGVEAVERQADARFLSARSVSLENLAALELFTSAAYMERDPEIIERVVRVVSESARLCIEHPMIAREVWYRHVGESPDPLTDAILEDTCTRFVTPVVRDRERWRAAWSQLDEQSLAPITRDEFEALYD